MFQKTIKYIFSILYIIAISIVIIAILFENYSIFYKILAVILIIILCISVWSLIVGNRKTDSFDFTEIIEKADFREDLYYEFFIKGAEEYHYSNILEQNIEFNEYKEKEIRILEFVKQLFAKSKAFGLVLNTQKQKLKTCKDCYKELKFFKKSGMTNKNCIIPAEYAEISSLFGIREIGKVVYIFEEIGMIMGISGLQGFLGFQDEECANQVLQLAEECGLEVRSSNIEYYDLDVRNA